MEELKPVKSGKVKVDDVNLYYDLYGQGDPLIALADLVRSALALGPHIRQATILIPTGAFGRR